MKRALHLFLLLIFSCNYIVLLGQSACPTPTTPADNDTPPGCTICEFPMTGSTNGYTAGPLTNGNYGCGGLTIENEQFVVFIANQPCVSFTIDASNCSPRPGSNNTGVQGFIFDLGLTFTYDCTQGCGFAGNPAAFVVNTCGLTPGNAYFLVIDGCAGALCNFTVTATGTQGGDFVDLNPAGPFCEGDNFNVQLVGNPPGGTFSGPVSPSGVFNPSVLGPGTYTMGYEYTNPYDCTDDDEITVVIHPSPFVSVSPAGPYCSDDDNQAQLNGSPAGGSWSPPVNPNGTFVPSNLGPGNYLVRYNYTDANGCSNEANLSFDIYPAPTVTLDPAGPFCETDDPVTLNFSPPGGTFTGPVGSNGEFDPATAGPGSHTINYSYTSPDGCEGEDEITIVVNPAPDVNIDPIPDFCSEDDPYNIVFSPPGGVWSGTGTTNGTIDPGVLGPGSYDVTYTVTNPNGCEDEETVTFEVFESPDVMLDPAGPFCENDDPVTLTFSPPGGTWTGPVDPSGEFDPEAAGPGTHTINYNVTTAEGCEDEAEIDIVVNPAPDVSIDPIPDFCSEDDPYTITYSPPGGVWSGTGTTNGNIDPSVLGPGSYDVTYTVTNAFGCEDEETVTFEIFETPDVMLDPAGPFCENDDPVTLNHSPSGGTWTGPVDPSGQFDPSSAGPGTHTINYNVTTAEGCEDEAEIDIVVNPAPDVTIDPIPDFCSEDDPYTITYSPPGGVWSGTGTTNGTIDPSVLGPGNYDLTYTFTNAFGCEDEETVSFEIFETPDVMLDPAGPFCENDDPVSLNHSPSGGTWTGPVGPGGQFDPSSAGPGTHTINYNVTTAEGCEDEAEIDIVVNPAPDVTIDPIPDFCSEDDPFTITFDPPGGVWSGTGTTNGTIDPSVLGPGNYDVTYTFTNAFGCEDEETVSFEIFPSPTVVIDPVGPLCENDDPINLNGSPSGGNWGGSAGPGGTFDPGSTGPGTHNVTYTYTTAEGCEDEDDFDIVVNPAPVVSIDPAGPFCENEPPVVLTASPSGGTWSGPVGPGGTFNPGQGPGSYTITYSFTNSFGCTEEEDITIDVNPLPVVMIDPPGPICENDDPFNLTASPGGGTWGGNVGSNGEVDPGTLGPGNYTATYEYTDANGCMGSDQIMFVINPSPVVTLDPAGPFCEEDDPVTLVFSPPGGTWSGPVSSGGVFDPGIAGPGIHNIIYSYTNAFGCEEEAEIDIEVNPNPEPEIDDPGNICESDPALTLSANPTGGTWGGVANSNGEIDPSVLGPGSHVVTYSYTDANGCEGSTQLTINIYPLPNVNIQPINPLCENDDPVTLNGTPAGGTWIGDVDASGTVDPSALGPGNFTANYEYTDSRGCSNSAMINFTINPAPVIDIDPAGPFCEDDGPVNLSATPAGGTWSGPVTPGGQFNPMTAGVGNHTVTYTFTNSFGCTEEEELDIEVNELPDIFLLSPTDYCDTEGPLFLDADPFGGTWGGAANAGGEIDPSTLGPGTYVVTYSYQDPNGCDVTENFNINVQSGPNVVINPAGPFCETDAEVTLSASPAGGDWFGDAGPNGEFDPEYLGPGIWSVEYVYEDNAGCIGSAVLEIEVWESPFVDFDLPDPICEGSPIQTLSASPAGGIWGGVANASGQVDPVTLGPGYYIATYTYTDANGCSTTEDIDIEIIELPEIDFEFVGPFCLKDEFTFLEVYPFGGFWTGDVDANGEFNPIDLGVGTFNATYTYEDFYGCINSASTTFEILSPFEIEFYGDSTFCGSQGPVTLNAIPSGPNGFWTGNIVSSNGQVNPSTLSPGMYTVTYTYIDQAGCENSGDLTVTITPPPTINISGDLTLCTTSGLITYTATPSGGTWGGVANANGEVDAGSLGVGSHIISYTVPYANGCTETFEQTITVAPPPTAMISGMGTICPGGNNQTTLQVTLTGSGPWQLIYALNGSPQVPVTVNSSPYTITTDQPGTYTIVSVSDASGCDNSGTGTGIVTEITPLSITGLDGTCDGTNTNFTLTFTINGGDPGSYMVSGVTGTLTGNVFTSNSIPSGTNVTITVSDNSGCSPVTDNILIDCLCETEVGSMNTTLIRNCGPGTVTAVYDPTGEFLDADDIIQYVLHTNAGVSLGTVIAVSNTPTFTFDPNTMMYGTTYYISAVAGSDDGTGNVDLGDDCLKVAAGTPVIWHLIPEAILTGDGGICVGASADLSISLTGQSPWTIRYYNGTDTIDLNGITTNPYVFSVSPGSTTTYEVVSVRNNFCTGTVNGTATVTVNDSPIVTDITTMCDPTYTNFTVSFTISGGDPNSYMVTGIPGTLAGNVFTSDPIASPGSFDGQVTDGNGCPPAIVADPLVDCGCLTNVGNMGTSTIRICGPGTATANYDALLEELDGDDIVRFVLHTNSGNTLGTILGTNTIPEFTFDPNTMMYGTTYYISAIAGNDDGSGNVDLNDPCLDISAGTPVIFRILPTATISGDQTICIGDTATLSLNLTGTGPWAVTYNNGSIDRNITPTSSPWTFTVVPTATTTYTVVSVRDMICTNTGTGNAVVTVNRPPTATLTPQTEICNTDENSNVTILNLYTLIVAGDNTGTWEDLDNSGATGNFDALNFIGITPGAYRFRYTTGAAPVPCPNVSYTITINVSDCSCPSVATSAPAPMCNDNAVLNLNSITITTEPGRWYLISTPMGSNPATLNGFTFNATNRDPGNYVVEYRLEPAPPAGCPLSSTQTIIVNAPPSATLTPNAEVCNTDENGNNTFVNLFSLITAGDATGSWVDLDNSGATGNFNNLNFIGITPGAYRFEYTTNSAVAPCNDRTYIVTITVGDCSCPSVATAPPADLCSDAAILDLTTITITNEPGRWTITGTPSGSNPATITGNNFNATGRDPGMYTLQFRLNQTPPPGCPNTSSQVVNVIAPPSAILTPVAVVCNTNQSGNPTTFNFATLITGGDATGSWVDLDNSGATGSFPMLDFNGITPGDYRFEYTTNSAVAPCNERTYIITITVSDCSCPSVATAPPAALCNDDAILNLTSITITNEPGTWSIIGTPSGSNPGVITGNVFNATGRDAGVYRIQFTLTQAPPTGCPNSSTQEITVIAPPVATVRPGVVVCNTNQNGDPTNINFSTLITAGDATGSWTDLDNSGATGSFPNLDFSGITPGDYRFEYTTNTAIAPCAEQTYMVTVTVSDCSCPSVATSAPSPLCNADAILDLSDITITSEAGSWFIISTPTGNNPATLNGTIFNATGRDAGVYQVEFRLSQAPPAGCPTSSTQTITVYPEVNAGQGPGTLRYCSDAVGTINLFDHLTGESTGGTWTVTSGSPGTNFNASTGVLNAAALGAGTYSFEFFVNGQDPCPDDTETITIQIENPVTAGAVISNPEQCEGEQNQFNLNDYLQGADQGGVWTEVSSNPSVNGAFDPANATFNTNGQANGTYTFRYSLIANAPCTNDAADVSITIHANPTADAGADAGLTCDTRRATLGGSGSSTGPNISYVWTGPGLSNPNILNPQVSGPGTFFLTVTNNQTGCTATDEVEVTQNEDLPTLNANSVDLTCFGSDNGVIEVNNVTGGLPPYLYALNGGSFTSQNIFTGLTPGSYTLTVQDANGCEDEVTFIISEPDELKVTLTVNLNNLGNVVNLGDSVLLSANVDGGYDTIYWQPSSVFEPCDPELGTEPCLKQWVTPTEITTYSVTVVDENGCMDSDQITLRVRRDRNVYIPSAFSPNDDGTNDGFRIYTDENVERIKSFLVFDRWGNLVYEYYDFHPDDPAGSWNGDFRNKPMDSAVFAYFAEVEFKDGVVELYKGDVTLVR